jgi:hypothetical protein
MGLTIVAGFIFVVTLAGLIDRWRTVWRFRNDRDREEVPRLW